MKTFKMQAQKREKSGTTESKRIRKAGMVPAILYSNKEQKLIKVDERELDKIVFTPDVFNVILELDGKEYSTIFQDVQFDPVTDKPIHADFLIAEEGKPVVVNLPVRPIGNSIGVKNGGRFVQPTRRLKVQGLLADIPEAIEIDITKLRIGRSVKVESLDRPGIEFLDPDNRLILAVRTARGAVEDEVDDEELEGAEGADEGAEDKKEEAEA